MKRIFAVYFSICAIFITSIAFGEPSVPTTVEIISPGDGEKFPVDAVVEVVAEVRDQLGNPMAGVEVTFEATGGAVYPITVFTPLERCPD
jgi:hypothetical protein